MLFPVVRKITERISYGCSLQIESFSESGQMELWIYKRGMFLFYGRSPPSGCHKICGYL